VNPSPERGGWRAKRAGWGACLTLGASQEHPTRPAIASLRRSTLPFQGKPRSQIPPRDQQVKARNRVQRPADVQFRRAVVSPAGSPGAETRLTHHRDSQRAARGLRRAVEGRGEPVTHGRHIAGEPRGEPSRAASSIRPARRAKCLIGRRDRRAATATGDGPPLGHPDVTREFTPAQARQLGLVFPRWHPYLIHTGRV
jgi:hypothetical protein